MIIGNTELITTGRLVKIAMLRNEWYEFLEEPQGFLEVLRRSKISASLFTFLEKPGEKEPKERFHCEHESIPVLPVTTYEHWLKKQVNDKTRNMVRKASRSGVEVREVVFDDAFIRGVTEIYNEFPVRQGRPFRHYGKDFSKVKQELSTFHDYSQYLGAYFQGELIGFVKVTRNGNWACLMQIISKLAHRDKAPTNALVAKAVELCERMGIDYLQYGTWSRGGLADFKARHGFLRMEVPRYFVALSLTGKIALRLRLHRAFARFIPESIAVQIHLLRAAWFARKYERLQLRQGHQLEISQDGRRVSVPAIDIGGLPVILHGKIIKIASVLDEAFLEGRDSFNPALFARKLKQWEMKPDVFQFSQSFTHAEPKFNFSLDMDNFAALSITTYEEWLLKQTKRDVKENLRRAKREGIIVRTCEYNDQFVWGIKSVYDETPVRQGRRFWHYNKAVEQIRQENGTFRDRSEYIGAFFGSEFIGFLKMVYVGDYAKTVQVIAKKRYFPKRVSNALIAKAVEICAKKGMKHLIYGAFEYPGKRANSLTNFKARHGFLRVNFPRYYVPLTLKGRMYVALGLHHGLRRLAPRCLVGLFVITRSVFHSIVRMRFKPALKQDGPQKAPQSL